MSQNKVKIKEVRTQAELDAVVEEFNRDSDVLSLRVRVRGDRSFVLPGGIVKDVHVKVYDTVRLESFYGKREHAYLRVDAYDKAEVTAYGNTRVNAYGSSKVTAREGVRVCAGGHAQVTAQGEASVYLSENATAVASGQAIVEACDWSRVIATKRVAVTLFDHATAEAYEQAQVTAYERTKVGAYGSVVVDAYEQSSVDAHEAVLVHAYGPGQVTATDGVHTWRHSAYTQITGGVVLEGIAKSLRDPVKWCRAYGVEVEDGMAVVYKALGSDLIAGKQYDKPTLYQAGTRVEADDWEPVEKCGNGLHFSPRPYFANQYNDEATRWMRVRIPVGDAIPIDQGGAPKIKAPWCDVVAEVDMFGQELRTFDEAEHGEVEPGDD